MPGSAGGLGNETEAGLERVDGGVKTEAPSREIVKILVGNWVAQWDETYQTWFYYNINTGLSLSLSPLRYQRNIIPRYQYMEKTQGTPTCPP